MPTRRSLQMVPLLAALGLFLGLVLLHAEPPSAQRIATLVKQLGSEDYNEREAATKALAALKESSRAALEKAVAVNKDPEVVQRATELVEKLDDALRGEVYCLKGHDGLVFCVAFSPDGNYALSGGQDTTLRLWDLRTGKEVRVFSGHRNSVNGVAFCPDGKRALSCGADATLRLWDVQTGKELRCFKGHNRPIYYVRVGADGKQAVSAGFDDFVLVWDLETGREVSRVATRERCGPGGSRGCSSPDRATTLWGEDDGTVRLVDATTRKELHRFFGHSGKVNGVAYSPDGKRVLSASDDGTVRLWQFSPPGK